MKEVSAATWVRFDFDDQILLEVWSKYEHPVLRLFDNYMHLRLTLKHAKTLRRDLDSLIRSVEEMHSADIAL